MPSRTWSDRHVVDENGCWIFQGCINNKGYGLMNRKGRSSTSHRHYYIHYKGEVPEGMDLDHLCRVTICCNPDHLEPVSRSENNRRGDGPSILASRMTSRTHCMKGHEYTEENTRITKRGHRACKECNRQWSRRYKARKKALHGS